MNKLLACVAVVTLSFSVQSFANKCPSKLEHYQFAISKVERKLISPRSAIFSGFEDTTIFSFGDGCEQRTIGDVDSHNNYGVMIRSVWMVNSVYDKQSGRLNVEMINVE
ncbi:hypothetical protein [Oceanisphaera ostreae]|uniref:Uncharacterized protein n=1 Tax=Oceanisphaera ostreae TaxID=914151 RepID=A0ABW3KNA6_9GAMM